MIAVERPTPIQKALARAKAAGHLDYAVPAQTPEDDAMEDMYSPSELAEAARDTSFGIMAMLKIKPGETIKDSYEPTPGQFIRHSSLPNDNHFWRAVSIRHGIFEVRTGPFEYDPIHKYEPLLQVRRANGTTPITPSGRKAFADGATILSDVIYGRPMPQAKP
jgi:hypothetical protein